MSHKWRSSLSRCCSFCFSLALFYFFLYYFLLYFTFNSSGRTVTSHDDVKAMMTKHHPAYPLRFVIVFLYFYFLFCCFIFFFLSLSPRLEHTLFTCLGALSFGGAAASAAVPHRGGRTLAILAQPLCINLFWLTWLPVACSLSKYWSGVAFFLPTTAIEP